MLFIRYDDDNVISYADSTIAQICEVLTQEIKKLRDWFSVKSLAANPSKFQSMVLSATHLQNDDPDIEISDIVVIPADKMKLLGVTKDAKFNFDDRITEMCAKAGNNKVW